MNIRQRLLVGATVMLLATGSTWARPDNDRGNSEFGRSHHEDRGNVRKAPEIDAASGTSAIALLTGIILLMKERRRSKRSSKSNE